MKISRVQIQNFRNIRNVNIKLGDVVTVIGENNSGKSNFLYALTLPFLSDDNNLSKNLSWADINSEARNRYYQFILDRKDDIINRNLPIDDFAAELPVISVEVDLIPEEKELYCVKDICYSVDADGNLIYGLRYEYKATHLEEILSQVYSILNSEKIDQQSIENIRMNLLPTRMYRHSVVIPQKNTKVAYDTLRQFKYMALSADRDNFSNTNERIGSRSLVRLLQMRLSATELLTVEKEYSRFFDALKNLSGMDQVINWQDSSKIPNAKDFFDNIDILPNMPPMTSIFSSVRLGYSGENLSSQGLGQRNLILLLVLLNSLQEEADETALRVLTVEEPEAHLCINNIRLMASFIKFFTGNNRTIQLFYSTHSTEMINKVDPRNVIVMNNGEALSLITALGDEERNYLSKNPNTDIFKIFLQDVVLLLKD